MSKLKTKSATVEAPQESASANASPWKLEMARSGTQGIKALLEFSRPPSAPVPGQGRSRTDEVSAAVKEFLATDPAALHYLALKDRLAKVQADLDKVIERHDQAQREFIADPSKADELETAYVTVTKLTSQIEALGPALGAALAKAKQAYAEFHKRRDDERTAQLRSEATAIAQKIEQTVAPLLTEFGAARAALRNENALIWPQFAALFPEPVEPATDEVRPPQYAGQGVNGSRVIVDNRFNLVPQVRPVDPNWMRTRPPVQPMAAPVASAEES